MKKIILASQSPQRKNLLSVLGLPFEVQPSQAQEKMTITSSCAQLVKDNALLKAKDVADRTSEGIVIGSDTVVYLGNKKILGKPKNFSAAKATLKLLMNKPQWIYTGVALIDAQSKKTLLGYEKTKVYMDRLTDQEIDLYHRRVSPLDKAGAFDIEGLGSVFINRIEGCYSSVIGLPLSRLRKMLKEMGVTVLSLVIGLMLVGCTSEFNLATQRQESMMYSTEREVNIGEKAAHSIMEKNEMVEDVQMNERAQRILDRIVQVADRKDVVYFIKIIDEDVVNAVSLPGGYIFLFKELMEKVESDDELAGVIAHEVAHITARHGVKRLQASYGALVAQIAAVQTNARVAGGVNFALTALFMEYSQQDEFQADTLAVKYMKAAGYDPKGMITFLEKLKEENEKKVNRYSYWKTHPNIPKRIAVVNTEINGEIGFKDYLNLTGSDWQ